MEENKLSPAQCVVKAFGSIYAIAKKVGIDRGNTSKWVRRGLVPTHLQKPILLKARQDGLELTAEELILGRDNG